MKRKNKVKLKIIYKEIKYWHLNKIAKDNKIIFKIVIQIRFIINVFQTKIRYNIGKLLSQGSTI